MERRDGDSDDSYRDTLSLTEKILKPLLRGHAFVLLCQPKGALRLLRSVGFRSFSPHMAEVDEGECGTTDAYDGSCPASEEGCTAARKVTVFVELRTPNDPLRHSTP